MNPVKTLSVVIPAYNAGESVFHTVREVAAKLKEILDWNGIPIIVVDDGSTDGLDTRTWSKRSGAFVVSCSENRGKGAAIRTGFAVATGDYVAFLDADSAYDPEYLKGFLSASSDAEVIIGRRPYGSAGGRPSLMRNLGSRFFHFFTHLALKDTFVDTQAGIKVMERGVAQAYAENGVAERFAFDVELLAMAEASGWRIAQVDVKPRVSSSSTIRFSHDVLVTCCSVLHVAYRRARGELSISR